jgi:putative ABC transport system permease protein
MKNHQPPKLAQRLFEWYCGHAKIEDYQGDLEEWFYINLKSKSVFHAKWIYCKQVLSLITSYAITKRKKDSKSAPYSSSTISLAMWKNYFIVAFRNLARQRYFTIINVLGLAIGMSISLLVIVMYSHVKSYDNFHTKRDQIYRIISTQADRELACAPVALVQELKKEAVEIPEILRIYSSFSGEVTLEKIQVPLFGYYVDQNFFSVFSFEMIQGNRTTALSKPNSLVLTESAAKKIFHKGDVFGKTFELTGLGSFEITGIIKDPPKNTHLSFEVLASYNSLPHDYNGDATSMEPWEAFGNQYIYLVLPTEKEEEKLTAALSRIANTIYKNSESQKAASFELQPLSKIVAGRDLSNEIGPSWNLLGFIIFGAISLLILLPACFNYTNISIARALKRSKEIGLRKTMGGLKNHIFFQFITETVVITFISLLGALFIFRLLRAEFVSMLVEGSLLDLSLNWRVILLFLAFAVFTGFLAGALPALYFAGLNPIQALKSQSRAGSGLRLRKVLTIFQFALSFCFIITLVNFTKQYQYTLHFDFGFEKEHILDVALQGVDPVKFENEFSRLSAVQSMSFSSGILGLSSSQTWVRSEIGKDSLEVFQLSVDNGFIENMKLKLLAGSNFPSNQFQDEKHIIVNEEFLKSYGIASPTEAIGKFFIVDNKELEVIGVLKDFHFASLQVPIKNFFFRKHPEEFRYANLKVSDENFHASFSAMEKVWTTLIDNRKFEARFFNDEINEAYDFYKSLLKIIGFLGLLAISISLLGLLGMVVYTSETKTKEVGIRKVMGATTASITLLLSKDYVKLMMWAVLFATPITVWVMEIFLSHFQHYRASVSVWDVVLSLFILLLMGVATIASQTFKTASTNPAETLKYE